MNLKYIVLLTALFLSLANAFEVPKNVYIDNLHRQLDISQSVIRENVAISVRAKKDDVKFFYLTYKKDLMPNLSTMVAFTKVDKEEILEIEQEEIEEDSDLAYFKVNLEKPINIGERAIVNIEVSIVKVLKPYPKYIEQNDDQYVLFSTNVYYLSPYIVNKQKTTFKIGETIKSYSEEPAPVKVSENDVYYGPYKDIEPGTEKIVSLHYKFKGTLIHFEKIERTIEISHWGHTVSYKEDLIVHHDGSELKNNFNRIAFQKSKFYTETPSSVKDMIFVLPPKAKDIFFVDTIGNVSTSAFHKDETRTLLQILPRYPLFGGWKYTWSQGYNNPLDGNVKYSSTLKKYVFQAPILLSIKHVPVDHFKLNVILPEGARNVDVHLPYTFDGEERKMTYSFLDTTGRPTIILEKENVCDDHFQYFQISYNLPFYFPLQKPIVVALFIFALFIISMIWNRLDLSIVKDPRADIHDLAVSYWETVGSDSSTAMKVLNKLVSVNETFGETKDHEAYEANINLVSEKLKESTDSLNKTSDLLKDIEQHQLANNIKNLIGLIEEKQKMINENGKKVYAFKVRMDKVEDDKKAMLNNELLKIQDAFNKTISIIDAKIEAIVNTQIL